MDHEQIEQQLVIDRYLIGTLPSDQATAFEQHYLHCQQCLEQLELGECLLQGLRDVAADEAAVLAVTQQVGLLAHLARLARSHRAQAMAAAALLLVVLLAPSGLLLSRLGELHQDLRAAQQELAAQPQEQLRQQIDSLEQQIEQIGRAQSANQQQLEAARHDQQLLNEQLHRARQPQANIPVVTLFSERSMAGSEPTVRLHLPPQPGWIVLLLELDASGFKRYHATIEGADQTPVAQLDALEPGANATLALSLHSSQLETGLYRVTVEPLPTGSHPAAVTRFRFRVQEPVTGRPS